jgi:phenylalanyl-tRNA synthetase beta chain
LTTYQRDRRRVREILCGLGASEAWTEAFVTQSDQERSGVAPPYIEVTNPLVDAERYLRSSMMPGLLRALRYNAERRQGSVRLFEVGSTFLRTEAVDGVPAEIAERVTVVFAGEGDDAWSAMGAWRTLADALGVADWSLGDRSAAGPVGRVVHPYRSSALCGVGSSGTGDQGSGEQGSILGVVGELDPTLVTHYGLAGADGRARRVGWLDLDLGILLDRDVVPRRSEEATPISRFPSSDIDLAFVVSEQVPAGSVERTLRGAGGDLLESLSLFDVYRGPTVASGSRSLAFRLRFCALDRTLTDEEVGRLRSGCIDTVEQAYGAVLR